jgi:xanthine dehydrogenase accessory factor
MKTALLNKLLQDRKAKRPVALATNLASGDQALVYTDAADGPLAVHGSIVEAARNALIDDRSTTLDTPEGEVFVHVFNPPLRMVIVGAVHIAQPLSRMASVSGYDVIVVDPRQSFATEDRFPGLAVIAEWPDEAMQELDLDRRTAVVTLTHDPKIDDPALEVALKSDAFYIGALGSRKTHAKRIDRLKESGFGEAQIGRIYGPVGLSLGAVSPAEIAVSILAQITGVLHEKPQKAAA